MKKSIASLIVVSALSLSLVIPAAATNASQVVSSKGEVVDGVVEALSQNKKVQTISEEETPACVQMESVGHGEFVMIANAKTNRITDDIAMDAQKGEIVLVTPTNDDEIFKTSDEKYLVKATNDSYLLADKVSINIDAVENDTTILNRYDLSERAVNEMLQVINTQKELGNSDFSIELYVPSKIADGDAVPCSGPTTSYYSYTDKDGYTWKMKDISIKYSGLHPNDPVKMTGRNTKAIAVAATNVIISGAGISSKIAKFTTPAGILTSLYDLYVAVRGPVTTCTSSDYISSMPIFDRIEKESYMLISTGTYLQGKTSHKVWINRIDCYQLYKSKHGESAFVKATVNNTCYSKYWSNSEMTISRYGWEDYLNLELYGIKVVLNGK